MMASLELGAAPFPFWAENGDRLSPECPEIAPTCYPGVTPSTAAGWGNRPRHHQAIEFIRKLGAGERIRTVDPNLGKVMLYP